MIVFYCLTGFGGGLIDAAWCAWTGNMVSANKVQGFLQSFYSLGGMLAPLMATTMIVKGGLQWYTWYYVMVSTCPYLTLYSVFIAVARTLKILYWIHD